MEKPTYDKNAVNSSLTYYSTVQAGTIGGPDEKDIEKHQPPLVAFLKVHPKPADEIDELTGKVQTLETSKSQLEEQIKQTKASLEQCQNQ
ncbi:MAG: hypothetical protein KDK71_03035, partial [Chlamydiia bacterium]|nr:hypothetical protein [Chlamydiia bacterium]